MKLALIAFTQTGCKTASRLAHGLTGAGYRCRCFASDRFAMQVSFEPITKERHLFMRLLFQKMDGIIFVSACGIAVRYIAPFVKDKSSDPAVVSVDECGNFAVPLLSGHLGGANELANLTAMILGGQAVISTATDLNGVFSVDSWAKRRGLSICNLRTVKHISSKLLEGETVGLFSDFPVIGGLPKNVKLKENGQVGICISLSEDKKPFPITLNLVPKIVTLGIGCRKGTSKDALEDFITEFLQKAGCSFKAVKEIATIDLKKEEPGLLAFTRNLGLPLTCYSAEQLKKVPGEFSSSAFVAQTTGVDNVCERAACAKGGRLLWAKQKADGITAALAIDDWSVTFEDTDGRN